MAVVTEASTPCLVHRELLSEQLWERLILRIINDEGMERSLAERVMNEALGFLRLVATEHGQHYAPAPLVDIGWHAFVLHTRDYASFCDRVSGSFIHHEPAAEQDENSFDGVKRTVAALKVRGYAVDESLWLGTADCFNHCTGTTDPA